MLSSFPKRRKGNPKSLRLMVILNANAVIVRVFVIVVVVL